MATKTTPKRTRDPKAGKAASTADGKSSKAATPRKSRKEVVVFTMAQIAGEVGCDPKALRKFYRETVENDGTYTRYKFPADAPATKKFVKAAMAHFNPVDDDEDDDDAE